MKDGADPNYQNAIDGSTALHIACEKLRVEVVRILIEAGADTSLLSKLGFSAADHTVKKHFLSPYEWQKSQKAARDEILKTLAEAKSYIGKIT